MNFNQIIDSVKHNAFIDELQKIAQESEIEDMSGKSLYTERDFAKYNKKPVDTISKRPSAPKNAGAQIKLKKAVSYGS